MAKSKEVLQQQRRAVALSESLGNSKFVLSNNTTPLRVVSSAAGEFREALDDAFIRVVTTDYEFVEDHTHSNIRLLLGYLACFVMGYGTLVSMQVHFEDCKFELFLSVMGYIILNFAMTQYTSLVEKDTIFVGHNKQLGLTVQLNSEFLRFSELYRLTITLRKSDNTVKESIYKIDSRLGMFFDIDGYLAAESVVAEVAEAINLIQSKSE